MNQRNLEVIVRLVILNNGNILLCRENVKDYYFLPGGHVEFAELMKDSIDREVKEELGLKVKHKDLIGVIENIFDHGSKQWHEVNFVFLVSLESNRIKTKEDHIDFYWKSINELENEKILPEPLKKSLIQWLKDRKFFFASSAAFKSSKI